MHGIKCDPNFPSLRKTRNYCINLGIFSSRFGRKKSKPKESKVRGGLGSDLVNRNFDNCDAHERAFTDVTFIRIKGEGWVYLSAIIDGRTSLVTGYELSSSNDTALAIKTLNNSLLTHPSPKIIHSDNALTYGSYEWIEACRLNNIKVSYSRPGNSLDNRPIEYLWAQLKQECVPAEGFADMATARSEIRSYFSWYNEKRIQRQLSGMSPSEYVLSLA